MPDMTQKQFEECPFENSPSLVLHAEHLSSVARRQQRDVEAEPVRGLELPVDEDHED